MSVTTPVYITLLIHTWDCGFKPDVSEQTVSQENKVQSSIRLNINARTSLIQRQQHSCIKSRVCIEIRSDAKSKRLWRRPYCMIRGRCQPVFKSMSMSPGSNVNLIQCQKSDGTTHFISFKMCWMPATPWPIICNHCLLEIKWCAMQRL